MLKYNPDTKVVFADDQAAISPIYEITNDQIPDLIANGATVDASANAAGKSDSLAGATNSGTQTDSTVSQDAPAASAPAAPVTSSATVEVLPVESVKTTNDVADPVASAEAGPAVSIDPQAAVPAVEGADAPVTAEDKAAQEKADADAGVDTTKDVQNVVIHSDQVGSLAGTAVTPDGTPVVEAQPDAVTVKGPEYPASSPVVGAVGGLTSTDDGTAVSKYDGLDHTTMIETLLDDLEGFAAMGKSEIAFVVQSLRNAFKG